MNLRPGISPCRASHGHRRSANGNLVPLAEPVCGTRNRLPAPRVPRPRIVWDERSLRRHLQQYLAYYHEWRTHPSLDKDAPLPRPGQPPTSGRMVQVPHSAASITTTNVAPLDCRPRRRRQPAGTASALCVHTGPAVVSVGHSPPLSGFLSRCGQRDSHASRRSNIADGVSGSNSRRHDRMLHSSRPRHPHRSPHRARAE